MWASSLEESIIANYNNIVTEHERTHLSRSTHRIPPLQIGLCRKSSQLTPVRIWRPEILQNDLLTLKLIRHSQIKNIKTSHRRLRVVTTHPLRCDNINLALLSSDLLSVVLQHLKNKNDAIRLLAATLFVRTR